MEVYAEINAKQLLELDSCSTNWILPAGVVLFRQHGSRACSFECEDKLAVSDLIEFLSDKGVSWQITAEEREGKRDSKKSKHDVKRERQKNSFEKGFTGFSDFKDPWHKNTEDEDN